MNLGVCSSPLPRQLCLTSASLDDNNEPWGLQLRPPIKMRNVGAAMNKTVYKYIKIWAEMHITKWITNGGVSFFHD